MNLVSAFRNESQLNDDYVCILKHIRPLVQALKTSQDAQLCLLWLARIDRCGRYERVERNEVLLELCRQVENKQLTAPFNVAPTNEPLKNILDPSLRSVQHGSPGLSDDVGNATDWSIPSQAASGGTTCSSSVAQLPKKPRQLTQSSSDPSYANSSQCQSAIDEYPTGSSAVVKCFGDTNLVKRLPRASGSLDLRIIDPPPSRSVRDRKRRARVVQERRNKTYPDRSRNHCSFLSCFALDEQYERATDANQRIISRLMGAEEEIEKTLGIEDTHEDTYIQRELEKEDNKESIPIGDRISLTEDNSEKLTAEIKCLRDQVAFLTIQYRQCDIQLRGVTIQLHATAADRDKLKAVNETTKCDMEKLKALEIKEKGWEVEKKQHLIDLTMMEETYGREISQLKRAVSDKDREIETKTKEMKQQCKWFQDELSHLKEDFLENKDVLKEKKKLKSLIQRARRSREKLVKVCEVELNNIATEKDVEISALKLQLHSQESHYNAQIQELQSFLHNKVLELEKQYRGLLKDAEMSAAAQRGKDIMVIRNLEQQLLDADIPLSTWDS